MNISLKVGRWAAMNEDGTWEAFLHKPQQLMNGWADLRPGSPETIVLDPRIWSLPKIQKGGWKDSLCRIIPEKDCV